MMRMVAAACFASVLMFGDRATASDDDALREAERQQEAELHRLRAVNSGDLVFVTQSFPDDALHTSMWLTILPTSTSDGWVDMRQCHSNLDPMSQTEIVYRYTAMRGLRITRVHAIESAWVENNNVLMRNVRAGGEICLAARVQSLRAVGPGRFRISSGPYHRRFFDGYFPMRLTLELRYPGERLEWKDVKPAAQPGMTVEVATDRLTLDARFTGMLTVALDFVAVD